MNCGAILPKIILVAIVSIALSNHVVADESDRSPAKGPSDFAAIVRDLKQQIEQSEAGNRFVLSGQNDWLFFVPEIRSLTVGPFWGPSAAQVSRAAKLEYADPFPAIIDFNEQLRARKIDLIVVPVPAKSAIYAEKLSEGFSDSPKGWRLDESHAAFIAILREAGVDVLDLSPTFREAKSDDGPLYCRTDTHWSGHGVELAAKTIAAHLRTRLTPESLAKSPFDRKTQTIRFVGDLTKLLDANSTSAESLLVSVVHDRKTDKPAVPSTASPVLLMGDSHTLVFHDPSLYAAGAGLPDQLAYELGQTVDLLGVRGSGATATRLTLLREKNRLTGKKVVIWCFATREFTESRDGWRKVPLPNKAE